MSKLGQVGDFCPNKSCADCGKRQGKQQKNIVKFGKTKAGRQRYQCKTCDSTFTETKGTIFYRRRTPDDEIIETLAFLAEGIRISSLSRVKGHKEDTILGWLRAAARHAEQVEAILLKDYQVSQAQIDALWAYVGHKGQKGDIPKAKQPVSSGDVP